MEFDPSKKEDIKKFFLELLEKNILVCDGAMGTMLYLKGVPSTICYEELNLSNPQIVRSIHEDYVKAGAQIIETNTFGANRFRLKKYGLEGKVYDINLNGAKIAKNIARGIFVAGSVGPLRRPLEPFNKISKIEMRDIFKEQVEALRDGGVDIIIIETMSDMDEMKEAFLAAKEVTADLPIICQMSYAQDGKTLTGMDPVSATEKLIAIGADVVGANCGVGPQGMLEIVEKMASVGNFKLSVQPNAGLSRFLNGKFVYPSTPNYMAIYAKKFADSGANIIGGCCGTTPDHIRAIADTVRGEKVKTKFAHVRRTVKVMRPSIKTSAPATLASKFGKKFVVTIEINPPKGVDISEAIEASILFKKWGVDAVNITDGPMGKVRMDPIALASIIKREVGLEPILHFTCRDRNVLGLQSGLLASYAMGIENVLALTGDPPNVGDYPYATTVFDVTSKGLIQIIKNLNRGYNFAGSPIDRPTNFCIGIGVNPSSLDIDKEIKNFEEKVSLGANFAQTQPIYDIDIIKRFINRTPHLKIPIAVGILPLRSYKQAEYLHNEVPGIIIPDSMRERMHESDKPEKEGILIAQELLMDARDLVDGVFLMPPIGRYDIALKVIDVLKDGEKK